jgi:hypothetical protein
MATSRQIDSAAAPPRGLVGRDYMGRGHLVPGAIHVAAAKDAGYWRGLEGEVWHTLLLHAASWAEMYEFAAMLKLGGAP